MARRTTRKRTTRKTTRKTTSKRSTSRSTLSAAQKRLKDKQTPPWEQIAALGFDNPVGYQIDWESRGLAQVMKATNISGIGYITDGEHPLGEDYRIKDYSWSSYCIARASGDKETPHRQGEREEVYQLRADQEEDRDTILAAMNNGAPEFLIANGTGTGKTVTTWSTVRAINPRSVLIVCPAAVIPVWQQHIRDMGDGGINVVVINYESLKKLVSPPDEAVNAKKTTTQNKHIALKGVPYTTFDVVVFDEAHKLANPTSQQSRIATKLANNAVFTLRLTATPGKDPAALHHLWRGLSWVTGDKVKVTDDKDFSTYVSWCRRHGITGIVPAPFGNGITFEGGDSDLENMRDIIYGSPDNPRFLGIRRVPDDWGETIRQPLPVELSAEDKAAYSKVVDDTVAAILDGKTTGNKDMSKGLAAMVSLRQKTGVLKAPTVVEYTKYALDDLDEQVVISAIYYRTMDTISELLERANIAHVTLTGENTPEEKEDNRRAFQSGEVKVIITSVKEGISLHAGEDATNATDNDRRLIVADLNWSPGAHTQVEGRINRDGKTGIITVPFLGETIDEKVTSRLLTGLRNQSIIQDSGEEDDLLLLADALGITLEGRK